MPGKRATFTPWTELHAQLYMRLTKMNNKVNTTKINRKQSPDTGIEPETSDMPGKRATFTPWTEHHAQLYMRLTKMNNMVNTRQIQQRSIENKES